VQLRDGDVEPEPQYEVSDAQVDAQPTLPPKSGNAMRVGHFRVYKNNFVNTFGKMYRNAKM